MENIVEELKTLIVQIKENMLQREKKIKNSLFFGFGFLLFFLGFLIGQYGDSREYNKKELMCEKVIVFDTLKQCREYALSFKK